MSFLVNSLNEQSEATAWLSREWSRSKTVNLLALVVLKTRCQIPRVTGSGKQRWFSKPKVALWHQIELGRLLCGLCL
ncbi:hypothetical protein WJX79_008395 [Trebouxia sp. C0005]